MTGMINAGMVVISIFAVLFFMGVYSTTRWEKTKEGINLMLFPISYILLALSSLSRRWDLYPDFIESSISITAWVMVSFLMVQRGKHVIEAQRAQREWLREEKTRKAEEAQNLEDEEE